MQIRRLGKSSHDVTAFCTKKTEILRIILCMGLLQINTVHDKIRC